MIRNRQQQEKTYTENSQELVREMIELNLEENEIFVSYDMVSISTKNNYQGSLWSDQEQTTTGQDTHEKKQFYASKH